MAKPRRNDITKEKLLELKNQGLTTMEIAERLNCSRKTVTDRMAEFGLSRKYLKRKDGTKLLEAAEKRFGKEKLAVSLNDFDTLFKNCKDIETYTSEIVFMHRLDIPSVMDMTDLPCVILTDAMDKTELINREII